MPIPPPPLTTICTHCDWKRTSFPTSDALKLNVYLFCRCPVCQHTELEIRPGSRAEIMRKRLSQFLR